MNRSDAERILALVDEIHGDLRGRIVSERWWLVWIVVGVDVLLAYSTLQALLWSGDDRSWLLATVRAVNVLIIFLAIKFIHRQAGGQRTATETYLWWIWTTYLASTFAVTLLETLAGLPAFTLAPMFALLAAIAFSNMAMVTDRFFLLHTAFFLGVACAMSLLRDYQLVIYAGCWFVILVALGLYYRLTHVSRATRHL
jgi:hypothetical protein